MATIQSVVKKNIRDATVAAFAFCEIPIVSENIIFSHPNGTEPSGNYCVINILEDRQKGGVSEATLTKQGETEEIQLLAYTTFRYSKVQFSFIGSSAYENGLEFENNLNNNRSVVEGYQRKFLAPVNKSSCKRLPKLRETDWIESAVLDCEFSYSVQRYQDIDWVEYIILNGQTFKVVGDQLFTFDYVIGGGTFGDMSNSTGGTFYSPGVN